MRYPRLRMLAALALASAAIQPATAQSFPSKPVRMVVGFAPGGSTDKLARVLAQAMTETLGQSVIVDNRPGAAGNLAAELAATAAPDGHVIFMATLSSQSINPHLYSNLKFDPVKSFEPIMLVAKYPLLLMAAPELPANNLQDFIAYTKANPDKLHFSSAGTGSPGHLAGEIYKSMTGVEATHVPYKGGGPAMLAVMSNEVQFAFETIPSAIGQVKGGKLKGLAVTSDERSAAAPNLPTMKEAGLKSFSVTSWAGLLAPAKTPQAVIDRLTEATRAALQRPAVRKALADDGAEPGGGNPTDFARFMASETRAWGEVVRAAGVKME
ncbi:Bug family tripartite tricarboxylate transporter substrate binding protein [Variovorax sp. DT-64]|uniref:Bug family tripartite tricarboxylate transporter substrate binding protein n=1 Tax=Variovorax sp. DT-64 TaxID=3396160 RepID=UPI003F1E30BD